MHTIKYIFVISLLVAGCATEKPVSPQREHPQPTATIKKTPATTPATATATAKVEQKTGEVELKELLKYPDMVCDSRARVRKEVRARHVAVELSAPRSESAIRQAYSKAMKARAELLRGVPFEKVEAKYSAGAASRGVNGGDLGFFKRGVMVPDFEKAAFCLPVKELSPVLPSDFGFHIIQVTAIR